jgi:hypothetical protein
VTDKEWKDKLEEFYKAIIDKAIELDIDFTGQFSVRAEGRSAQMKIRLPD